MSPGISLHRESNQLDEFELSVQVFDGSSRFGVDMYVLASKVGQLKENLATFVRSFKSGVTNFQSGEFGYEYAGGAAHIRINLLASGKLLLTCRLEGRHKVFDGQKIADSAIFHCISELEYLLRFIDELDAFWENSTNLATLEVCT